MTDSINQLPIHANHDDRHYVHILVKDILSRGHHISVFDGEEYALCASNDLLNILMAMSHTGEDWLYVKNAETGEHLGHFYLIYDNGSEGDPAVVCSDHSNNELCHNIIDKIYFELKYPTYYLSKYWSK